MPLTNEMRMAGARASAEAQRRRAVTAYYQQPNYCLQCAGTIHIVGVERPSSARKRKFCSRSCAASYNNAATVKRQRRSTCLVCNKAITSDRKYCSAKCRELHCLLQRHARFDPVKAIVAWRRRLKLRAIQYKGGGCRVCGYNRCPRALNFHHIYPTHKDFNVSGSTKSWQRIKAELDKCVLLCANCHAEVHDGLLDVYKLAESESNRHLSD